MDLCNSTDQGSSHTSPRLVVTTGRTPVNGGSPIRHISQLPLEILVQILLNSMYEDELFGLQRHRELASVCRHWNEVVLSTHQFWTSLTDDPRHGNPFHLVPKKLKRFPSSALTVEYNVAFTFGVGCWTLLGPTSDRWGEASLGLNDWNSETVSLALEKGMPNLKRLTLRFPPFEGSQRITLINTPRLVELTLVGHVLLDVRSNAITLCGLKRLTLDLDSISMHSTFIMDLLPTLAVFPVLEQLDVQRIRPTSESTFTIQDVTLQHLKIINIAMVTQPVIDLLLRHVQADNLEQLRVESDFDGNNLWFLPTLIETQSRSGLLFPIVRKMSTSTSLHISPGRSHNQIRIADGTGRLHLASPWDNQVQRNLLSLYRYCQTAARSIDVTLHLECGNDISSLHFFCRAGFPIPKIHFYDTGVTVGSNVYKSLLETIGGPCKDCTEGTAVIFPNLLEIRLDLTQGFSLARWYHRAVQMAYDRREKAIRETPSRSIPPLKIYVNDELIASDAECMS